jgi:uncharacterized protein (DUF302 family)
MKNFQYTVESNKPFEDTVRAVQEKAAEAGFRVLHTHDIAGTLREKGYPREALKIVEICNARYASEVLSKDVQLALMLPCPVAVYDRGGKTFISTMLPSVIAEFYPQAGIEGLAREVEAAVVRIVDQAGR